MKQRKGNRHVGSSLDDFLEADGIFEETQTKAVKEVVLGGSPRR